MVGCQLPMNMPQGGRPTPPVLPGCQRLAAGHGAGRAAVLGVPYP